LHPILSEFFPFLSSTLISHYHSPLVAKNAILSIAISSSFSLVQFLPIIHQIGILSFSHLAELDLHFWRRQVDVSWPFYNLGFLLLILFQRILRDGLWAVFVSVRSLVCSGRQRLQVRTLCLIMPLGFDSGLWAWWILTPGSETAKFPIVCFSIAVICQMWEYC
jgi:hypothetical protein